ncbi:MAG: A24 family peptidase [Lachnospiraceae bacterium]|nr:A24 family peptidase [Lachnospiraceae bacterium]MDE7286939.1 A24 family peptidase [Lachnospiraceae bacterium]
MAALLAFALGIAAGCLLRRFLRGMFHVQIRMRCLLLEGMSGLLYMLVFLSAGWTAVGGILCSCVSLLLAVGIVDQKTYEIPVKLNVGIGILGIIHLFLDLSCWLEYLAGMFAASGLLLMVYFLSRRKGIGGGDIKLMAASGLLLGWEKIILALFIGAVSGAVIHILLMWFRNKDRVLAFGPYLSFGIFIAMLYGDGILNKYLLILG